MPEQKRYLARVAAGLCTSCGQRRARRNRRTCKACGETIRELTFARTEQLAREGMCVKCGKEPQAAGRLRCTGCLAYHADRVAAAAAHN
jgi:hypothetical protein